MQVSWTMSLFNRGRGQHSFWPRLCINKVPEFYIIFARKSNKIPEFYTRHLPENARIYIIFGQKICFRDFFGGVGTRQPPSPVSYAYGWTPGPPPAKSGPAEHSVKTYKT